MISEDFSRNLGQRLRTRRQAKALRLNDLARQAGVAASTLSELETGKSANPGIVTVVRLARALDVRVGNLIKDC